MLDPFEAATVDDKYWVRFNLLDALDLTGPFADIEREKSRRRSSSPATALTCSG